MHKFTYKLTVVIAASLLISGCAVSGGNSAGTGASSSEAAADHFAVNYGSKFGFMQGYLKHDSQLPDGSSILPKPADTEDPAYYYDFAQYQWGKTVRENDKDRLKLAQDDEVWGADQFKRFSSVFGMEISQTNTPEIWKLMAHSLTDVSNTALKMKSELFRKRPFVQFNEESGKPEAEKFYAAQSSYPSGHTAFGWGTALLLAEINPACQQEILSRGYEFGQSRVILGHHYQSDVDDGRIVASMVITRLHAVPEFLSQMEKAKAEFAALKAKQTKQKKTRARK